MANYNHARYLPNALQALLDQTYLPTEIIVIDDGSTDNSVEVIKQFVRKSALLRLICNDANRGVLYSINRALDLARGEYVSFLAADDQVLPDFLERSMSLLIRYPEAALCSGLCLTMDEEGRDRGRYPSPVLSDFDLYLSSRDTKSALRRYGSWFMGNATVFRRTSLVEAGGFRPELHSFCDGFVSMVLALKHGACFIPKPLAYWRLMESGYSLSTESNWSLSLDIRDNAVELMRTTYKDVFPEDIVESWARGWSLHAGVTAWNRTEREQCRIVEKAFGRLTCRNRWQGRLLVGSARVLVRTEAVLMKLLIFATLADFPGWVNRKLRLLIKRIF
jgi:glycosyltransferase involved in cell wall biosynthesis